MINAENISEILFNNDPANTMCVENDAYDEYDRIAEDIESVILDGNCSAHYAVTSTLFDSFGPLDELDEDAINMCIKEIDALIND